MHPSLQLLQSDSLGGDGEVLERMTACRAHVASNRIENAAGASTPVEPPRLVQSMRCSTSRRAIRVGTNGYASARHSSKRHATRSRIRKCRAPIAPTIALVWASALPQQPCTQQRPLEICANSTTRDVEVSRAPFQARVLHVGTPTDPCRRVTTEDCCLIPSSNNPLLAQRPLPTLSETSNGRSVHQTDGTSADVRSVR